MYRSLVHNGRPLVEPGEFWEAVDATYNSAESRQVDMTFLDDMPQQAARDWPPFALQELRDAIAKVSGRSAPGEDHLRWPY
ncbi:uncharacterized protein BXZ73DRAFT_46378, partial [Epithele typhae]|uniref:uncharacterized protein n=1 Tax=Epithele typhae TaxID=378194 RepID=UPI002007F6B9